MNNSQTLGYYFFSKTVRISGSSFRYFCRFCVTVGETRVTATSALSNYTLKFGEVESISEDTRSDLNFKFNCHTLC